MGMSPEPISPTSMDTTGALALARGARELYERGQTDYSFDPIVLTDPAGTPVGRIRDGDTVIFCCRRGEREIELTEAFTEPSFSHFERPVFNHLPFIILTLYHDKFVHLPVAFAPSKLQDTLAEVVSRAGLRQLHIAESEKFPHVTFFFNGGNNQMFLHEEDVRVPSPKGMPFDQVPGMSLPKVVEEVRQGIEAGFDLIVTNFANGDVIGHTSNIAAKIRCAEHIDAALGQVIPAAIAADYVVIVTADHGNLEEMIHPDGTPHVSHTTNPVAFILIDGQAPNNALPRLGNLADVAPTILAALRLEKPLSMDGHDLVPGYDWGVYRKVLLIILDGWGLGRPDETNPIHLAATPYWDDLTCQRPTTALRAAGEAVGLQLGKAGNSEAGHLNLGAGRVVPQDDVRLEAALADGSFYTNEMFCRAIDEVKECGSALHLIGLLSEKSSHGSIDYPLALLRMARSAGLERVYLHLIFDGRSTEPGSAPVLLEKLDAKIKEIGVGRVVTGVGRSFALDRDGNYARIKIAFDALVWGNGHACPAS